MSLEGLRGLGGPSVDGQAQVSKTEGMACSPSLWSDRLQRGRVGVGVPIIGP